ncbi:MAG: LemA family protein [Candidatus Muiribacterium halophilum]|uniref:LemA family protein n=1 Tax=Muiribacterium halophilum TaxID=2053465 RepID=A0A2N5ZC08_MUIH1|nr:MAG: LemA family protein [Candidatus Muirbacterium halophilum]
MKKLLFVLAAIFGLGLIFFGFFVGKYNQFVVFEENTKENWAEIDNQLKRRADLIPNLVETVKGYAKHEDEIFTKIAEARTKLLQSGSVKEKQAASSMFEGALGKLLAISENYPNLKADKSFIRLQDELAGTENRLAVARKRYNESVQLYNKYIRLFPNNFISGIYGFEKKDYFKISETDKQNPEVSF